MNRFLRTSYLVACVAGVGFFVLSVLILGVWPGRVLEEETRRMSPEHPLKLTASEQRGRAIYSKEGCAYCHTQQIRFLKSDVIRFGAPTLAWETQFDYPHLWGTRRIGPDLSREGGVHSPDWHFSHLYSPRSIVPESVMPAYPTMFNGAPDRPTQEARDVLAYIESLGRARELAGPEGEARMQAASHQMDDMQVASPVLNASPAKARRTGTYSVIRYHLIGQTTHADRGLNVYNRHCAGCHGSKREGDGPGAKGLLPRPANLTEHDYSRERFSFVLWNGVAGTAMPAWRDLSKEDLDALADFLAPAPSTRRVRPPGVPRMMELGRSVYAAHCAQCHGVSGEGDGSAARELAMLPSNFHDIAPVNSAILRAIRNGVEGTPMAPWTAKLTDAEIIAVALVIERREWE